MKIIARMAFGMCLLLGPGCTRPNPLYQRGPGPGAEDLGGGAEDLGAARDLGEAGDLPASEDQGLPEGPPPVAFRVVPKIDAPLREDQPFVLEITPVDEEGAPTRAYRGRPQIRATYGDIFLLSTDYPTRDDQGRFQLGVRVNREGEVAIKAVDGELLGESVLFVVRHGRWELSSEGPVLSWGTSGAWDDRDANMPEVRIVDERLVMLYRGRNRDPQDHLGGIGRADWKQQQGHWAWERYELNPLMPDEPEENGGFLYFSAPSFLRQERGWTLWFSATSSGEVFIAHAVSDHGVSWRRPPENPVLEPDRDGARPEDRVYDPCVLPSAEHGYEMWYSIRYEDGGYGIGYASSEDGKQWAPSEPNPVLTPTPGAWDAGMVTSPTVIKDGRVYRMWYAGRGQSGEDGPRSFAIGYASSRDGVRWKKSLDNPVLSPGGAGFDSVGVEHPSVLLTDHELRLFYAGFNGQRWKVGEGRRAP